jgi:hypothetical protein
MLIVQSELEPDEIGDSHDAWVASTFPTSHACAKRRGTTANMSAAAKPGRDRSIHTSSVLLKK